MFTKANVSEHLHKLDQQAGQVGPLHSVHTGLKLILTLLLIVVVSSLERFDIVHLAPFAAIVIVFARLAGLLWSQIILRFLPALPLVLGVGIPNLFFDEYGIVALISLLGKTFICLTAGLVLVASSGIERLAHTLRSFGLPAIMCTQIVMMWRYSSILVEEVSRILTAYALRAGAQRGVALQWWGSLAGQLLLRSVRRAERVHAAMKLRGFGSNFPMEILPRPGIKDITIFCCIAAALVVLRFFDPSIFGAALIGIVG